MLGDEADAVMAAFGVTRHGNIEGKNILEFVGDMDQRPALTNARRRLYRVREERVHPGLDDKVLTSWNGLMLAAFSEASRVLIRDDYREVAERNAEFVLSELRLENGRQLRTWKACPEQSEGAGKAKLNGDLEDYSNLIEELLELYQSTFEPRWFVAAGDLAETMIAHFQSLDGGFQDTNDDHETLITRPGLGPVDAGAVGSPVSRAPLTGPDALNVLSYAWSWATAAEQDTKPVSGAFGHAQLTTAQTTGRLICWLAQSCAIMGASDHSREGEVTTSQNWGYSGRYLRIAR